MLGRIDNDPETLLEHIRAVLRAESAADGLSFDSDGLRAEPITALEEFLGKAVYGLNEQHEKQLWQAGGPWRPAERNA